MSRARWPRLRVHAAATLATLGVVGTARAQSGGTYEGRVTWADGRPIAGAEISIGGNNANAQPTGAGAKTDASGHYAIRVGPGQYHPTYATYKLMYNGQQYFLGFAQTSGPTENQEARGRTVCNFELRTHGLIAPDKDPNDPNSYWGGTVEVGTDASAFNYKGWPSGSSVQLTLTPRGPLLDGSAGQVLTLTQPTVSNANVRFKDIPLGAYTATVRLVQAGGVVLPLHGRPLMTSDPDAQTIAVDFPRKFGVAVPNGGPYTDGGGGGTNVKAARLGVAP